MLLSVIIPVYNVKPYLKKCIESVLSQEEKDYEVILVDDCSTDGSLSIAEEYESDARISLIRKEKNTGLSDTRNTGMRSARGEYILFLDSDDYIEPGAFGKIREISEAEGKPDIIYFGFYEETGGEVRKRYGYRSEKNRIYRGKEFAYSELAQRNLYAPACFGIYKRSLLMENDLFFEVGILHEDELWTPQAVMHADTIYLSDYAYYHYIRHENSITGKKDKTKNGEDLIRICNRLDRLYGDLEPEELRKLMDNHIAMLYMKGVSRGRLYRRNNRVKIRRFYPLQKACLPKDRVKAVLFAVSLRLYSRLNRKFK